MKNKHLITISSEEKDARLKLIEVSKLYSHPLKIIRATGASGVKGGKRLIAVFFIYVFSNVMLFLFTLERVMVNEFRVVNLLILLAVILILVGTTIFVTYRAYRFLITDTIRVLHQELIVVFKDVSEVIIDKVLILSKGRADLSKINYEKVVNFPNVINDHYKMLPKFLRKGIINILNIVPLTAMVMDIKDEVSNNNKVLASKKLYAKMDDYIVTSLNAKSKSKWIWWLLPFKILFVIIFVLYCIG
jgi:hypothetical protein